MANRALHRIPGQRRRERPASRSENQSGALDQAHERDEDLPKRPTAQHRPSEPTELGKRSWWAVLKRTVKELKVDNLSDWAAALTYYGVLSLFPGCC